MELLGIVIELDRGAHRRWHEAGKIAVQPAETGEKGQRREKLQPPAFPKSFHPGSSASVRSAQLSTVAPIATIRKRRLSLPGRCRCAIPFHCLSHLPPGTIVSPTRDVHPSLFPHGSLMHARHFALRTLLA